MRHAPKSDFVSGQLQQPIEQLLASANPISPTALESAELAAAFDRLGERIVESRPQTRRRRSRRFATTLVFAAVALVAAAIATGALITTHTGFFPKVAGTENDTSDFLRTDAPDFPPLVHKLVRDIPFPPGYSREAYISRYLNAPTMKPDSNGIANTVQAAGIRGTIGFFSLCAWRGYWLNAHAGGDASAEAAGAAGLAGRARTATPVTAALRSRVAGE